MLLSFLLFLITIYVLYSKIEKLFYIQYLLYIWYNIIIICNDIFVKHLYRMNSKKKKYKNYTKALIKLSYKQFKFALNKMRRKKNVVSFYFYST